MSNSDEHKRIEEAVVERIEEAAGAKREIAHALTKKKKKKALKGDSL